MLFDDYVLRLQRHELQDSDELLTDRKRQVRQLLAGDMTNKEVAATLALGVSRSRLTASTSCKS
jgi:hypothetical protein